jgi:hypothetical protein
MSAYIVEDPTINRILSWLHCRYAREQIAWGTNVSNLFAELGYDLDDSADIERLGQAMFQLNIAGVEERYGAGEAAKFRPLDYQYRPIARCSLIQTIKSIDCWHYQCTEGDVMAKSLYRTFSRLLDLLCGHIVRRSAEYDAAQWE